MHKDILLYNCINAIINSIYLYWINTSIQPTNNMSIILLSQNTVQDPIQGKALHLDVI